MARSALQEQDYARAAILLCEAIQKHEQDTGQSLGRDEASEIKAVRKELGKNNFPD